MVLRRITVDNSVSYIAKSEQTRENKPIMMKNKIQSEQIQPFSRGGKLNKNISQNNKKILKKVTASGLGNLTK